MGYLQMDIEKQFDQMAHEYDSKELSQKMSSKLE